MTREISIRAENLGKQYRITQTEQYKTLQDAITRSVKAPFCRIKDRLGSNNENNDQILFWALRGVSFDVEQGEVVGIIGRNGSGKSTLLKILSRITPPTEGTAEIHGRVGSLLEVGTGFHPELTGRENIYLSGSILGMRKCEINDQFDEIVKFSEIEKYLDTPVKRYSSGMYVRLAFAVAAHLNPEILMVDEVLAVGDVAFQKKCLGKISDVASCGRTVLFVSHNMGAIQQLCEKAILLEKGALLEFSNATDAIHRYHHLIREKTAFAPSYFNGTLKHVLEFKELTINDKIPTGEIIIVSPSSQIELKVIGLCKDDIPSFRVAFSIFKDGTKVLTQHDVVEPKFLEKGLFESKIKIPPFLLRPGEYSVSVGGNQYIGREWIWGADLAEFLVIEEWSSNYDFDDPGIVNIPHDGERVMIK